MQFTPQTREQIEAERLWNDGKYRFEILEAFEAKSKAGDDMIEMKVKIINGQLTQVIKDYLVSINPSYILNFCESVGLLQEYQQGLIAPHILIGKTGLCLVKVNRDPGFTPRNKIYDYYPPN